MNNVTKLIVQFKILLRNIVTFIVVVVKYSIRTNATEDIIIGKMFELIFNCSHRSKNLQNRYVEYPRSEVIHLLHVRRCCDRINHRRKEDHSFFQGRHPRPRDWIAQWYWTRISRRERVHLPYRLTPQTQARLNCWFRYNPMLDLIQICLRR